MVSIENDQVRVKVCPDLGDVSVFDFSKRARWRLFSFRTLLDRCESYPDNLLPEAALAEAFRFRTPQFKLLRTLEVRATGKNLCFLRERELRFGMTGPSNSPW